MDTSLSQWNEGFYTEWLVFIKYDMLIICHWCEIINIIAVIKCMLTMPFIYHIGYVYRLDAQVFVND